MPGLRSLLLKSLFLLLAFTTFAAAQEYPTKPVRVIIPFPPGAINDTIGRLIATQLSNRLGKQFVVDNRAGAGGVLGTELAANAPKDGYTLLIVSLVNTVNPWLSRSTTIRSKPLRRSPSSPLRRTCWS
jgi:tripartite-type tricarboxylate transporter receptor subunit TctC